MYDFLEKLVNVTFPRVRDFRGIESKNIDKSGNLNIGFKEHVAFPEIKADQVDNVFGLEIAMFCSNSFPNRVRVLPEATVSPLASRIKVSN